MPSRVLIVSPHFPPVNAPDHQRVRMSLPYLGEFGWEGHVLAVVPLDQVPRHDAVAADIADLVEDDALDRLVREPVLAGGLEGAIEIGTLDSLGPGARQRVT